MLYPLGLSEEGQVWFLLRCNLLLRAFCIANIYKFIFGASEAFGISEFCTRSRHRLHPYCIRFSTLKIKRSLTKKRATYPFNHEQTNAVLFNIALTKVSLPLLALNLSSLPTPLYVLLSRLEPVPHPRHPKEPDRH